MPCLITITKNSAQNQTTGHIYELLTVTDIDRRGKITMKVRNATNSEIKYLCKLPLLSLFPARLPGSFESNFELQH